MASAKGARTAAIWGSGRLQDNETRVLGELGVGFDKASGYLDQGREVYSPYAQRYEAGSKAYSDAIGLNGAGGNASALQQFQAGPGYQFNMDQGLQALTRARSAQGMLGSGNTDTDALKFASGLANQGWNSWLDRLNGFDQRGLATAGQISGSYGQQAGLVNDYYGNRASTIDNTTKSIVGLGTEALKAGDVAKAANQQMALGAASSLAGLVGKGFRGGGFTSLLSAFGK